MNDRPTTVVGGSAHGGRWELATREPPLPLKSWVSSYSGYVETRPTPFLRREFPSVGVVAVIEFTPPIRVTDSGTERGGRYRGGFVAGVYSRWADCLCDGRQAGMQLSLTPLGARLLFGVPLNELAERCVPVVDLLPRAHRDLPWRLAELGDWPSRFARLDRALLDALQDPTDRTRIVGWGLDRIVATGGAVDIGRLVRELGYSHKHVVRLFRDQVGLPPKEIARLARFQRLAQAIDGGRRTSWGNLAYQCGFSDQAHLSREVKRHTGLTPTAFEAASRPSFGTDVHSVQDAAFAPA